MSLHSFTNLEIKTSPSDLLLEQMELNQFYLRELGDPSKYRNAPLHAEYTRVQRLEDQWNSFEESRIKLNFLPKNADEFLAWYNQIHVEHRHEVAPFFARLAESATLDELAFYIAMEEQVDGRFDDVIALAQLGMSGDMKMALAENYWDEMGLGVLSEMHTLLFNNSAAKLREFSDVGARRLEVPAEAFKNGNLLLMYSLRRQYQPRLLGALAILEHTAPYRFAKTVSAMRRLGMPEEVIYYHDLHIRIDANHGKQLLNRVLLPLIKRSPEVIRELCIGCLIRYNIAVDYYNSVERAMKKLSLTII